jgi:hypothetical protein
VAVGEQRWRRRPSGGTVDEAGEQRGGASRGGDGSGGACSVGSAATASRLAVAAARGNIDRELMKT